MLSDLAIGKDFVERIHIALIKAKFDKLDFIKIRNSLNQKTLKKVKMQSTD